MFDFFLRPAAAAFTTSSVPGVEICDIDPDFVDVGGVDVVTGLALIFWASALGSNAG